MKAGIRRSRPENRERERERARKRKEDPVKRVRDLEVQRIRSRKARRLITEDQRVSKRNYFNWKWKNDPIFRHQRIESKKRNLLSKKMKGLCQHNMIKSECPKCERIRERKKSMSRKSSAALKALLELGINI
jgi:hypothetical protein